MKKTIRVLFSILAVFCGFFLLNKPVEATDVLVPACARGEQFDDSGPTGSEFRIYMPLPSMPTYNGRFIVWAHGFQDVTDEIGIPENQLCFDGVCLPDIAAALGIGFATSSYRKTGLAVKEGMADTADLVEKLTIYGLPCGLTEAPDKVYIVGASEGGLITTLLAEQNPDVYYAAYALCGPIGDFPLEINYLGDARVTFEYFFPGQIPGYGIFNDIFYDDTERNTVPPDWDVYFNTIILPLLTSHPWKARQWFKVAKLPYDPENYLATVLNSAKDVLRYSVVNLLDAVDVLWGEPFDNRWKWYTGSYNDFRLNLRVKRLTPDAAAIIEMKRYYNTRGALDIPLITMHTTCDQQVPYWQEMLYNLKTIAAGSFLTDHVNIPVHRYGHCNFTIDEALGGFALMLLYAGDWEMLSALETFITPMQP
jgi:pimeloyl-ACP methyl ester carboxylesterase